MTPNNITVLLSVICMVFVAHSWYVHYRVKDGLARLMLLWGCALIFFFLLSRSINIMLLDHKVINDEISRNWNFVNTGFIYVIVLGQWFIQRHRVERDEDKQLQSDKRALKRFRKG